MVNVQRVFRPFVALMDMANAKERFLWHVARPALPLNSRKGLKARGGALLKHLFLVPSRDSLHGRCFWPLEHNTSIHKGAARDSGIARVAKRVQSKLRGCVSPKYATRS